MIDAQVSNSYAQSAAAAQAAVQAQIAEAQAAAAHAAVAPEMPTETVMGGGSGLPF